MTSLTLRPTDRAEVSDVVAPHYRFPVVTALFAALAVANVASVVAMLLAA